MTSTGTSLQTFVNALVGLANSIIPLLLAVAVIVFIWGIIYFLAHPDSPEEHNNMKSFMIWGIIAITVILSIWGLASMLKNTLFPSAPCPIGISGCGSTSSSNAVVSSPSNIVIPSGSSVVIPSAANYQTLSPSNNVTSPAINPPVDNTPAPVTVPTGSELTFPSASGN